MNYEDVINIINAHYGWSMVAHEPEYKDEIKEKMQAMKQLVSELQAKAKAFDESLESFKELERLHEEVRKVSKRNQDKAEVYKEVLFHVIREMESNLGESGE